MSSSLANAKLENRDCISVYNERRLHCQKEIAMKNSIHFGILALVACLMAAAVTLSQSTSSSRSAEFDHTTVHVRDLQKSAEFYEKVFGLQQMKHPFNDTNHIWFRVGAHQQLHVVGGGSEAPMKDIEVHFALRVPSIPAFTAHLDQMQVKYRSFDGKGKITDRPDGVHQIYLQYLDGYCIEVNDNRF